MQNWNQWQVPPSNTVVGTMPQPPAAPGYPTPGTDPMATMQAYMQYYNQPAPSGYTPEQWAAAQQQNWAQWQQWQQQYQQWQAQYGAKYQESIKQMSGVAGSPATLSVPPPLPKEDNSLKPPLPPDNSNMQQNMSVPPPHQNNLPLFPTKTTANPPLPPGQPPPPPDNPPSSNEHNITGTKRSASSVLNNDCAKKLKNEDDELTDAEKRFDRQFKEWEERFNKWKQQNINHPDKTQYKEYEAKWASWRETLIERREQMRKKREAQKAKTDAEKKIISEGDKLLNILSNTENQGLINNLLGIGKTLGLSGKDELSKETVQNISSTVETTAALTSAQNIASSIHGASSTSSDITQQVWAAQQWAQYNMAAMTTPTFPNYPPPMSSNQPMSGNQPPYNSSLSGVNSTPNFSQPPPGFSINTQTPFSQSSTSSGNRSDQNSLFRQHDRSNLSFGNKNYDQQLYSNRFNSDSYDNNNRHGGDQNQGSSGSMHMNRGQYNDTFNRDGPNRYNDRHDFGCDRIRSNVPGGRNNDLRSDDGFESRDRNYGNDRMDRDEGGLREQDRFGGSERDSFNSRFDRMPTNRFGSDDRMNNRSLSIDRIDRSDNGSSRFDSRDSLDRRDNSGSNNNNVGRSGRFEPVEDIPPELKKLMEKRKVALDVFKPSSSFLSNDRSNTTFGSLSDSFKKITGDSLFSAKDRPDSNRGNSDTFRASGSFLPLDDRHNKFNDDSRLRSSDFRSREDEFNTCSDSVDSVNRNSSGFGSRGGNNARESELNADNNHGYGNFMNQSRTSCRKDASQHKNFRRSETDERPIDNKQKQLEECSNESLQLNMPPLDVPPWLDPQIMKNQIVEIESNKNMESSTSEAKDLSNVNDFNIENPKVAQSDVSSDEPKKLEVLPFMGENDPKPEDLNMEPPPELPNLGPIRSSDIATLDSHDSGYHFDRSNSNKMRSPFESTESGLFGAKPPDSFEPRMPNTFGARDQGPFGSRGPNAIHPRGLDTFGPRNMDPFNQRGSESSGSRGLDPFGPRESDTFGIRGPDSFGPRGLDSFGLRRSNSFGPRGPDSFNSRNSNAFGSGGPDLFGPRGPDTLGPRGPDTLGPRGPDTFGSGGPNLFDSRGPAPFDSRGPAPFDSRGSGPFDSRGPSLLDSRGSDAFDSRGPDSFGPRRSDSIDARGPDSFETRGLDAFNSRGRDDRFLPFGPGGIRNIGGPGEGPHCGPDDNRFEMRNPNDPFFGPRGPDNFGPQGLSTPFGPRGSDNFDRESNMGSYGPCGLNNIGPGIDNISSGQRLPFGSHCIDNRNFPQPGLNEQAFDPLNQGHDLKNIPSLLSVKINAPTNLMNEPRDINRPPDLPFDRPFREDINRPPFGPNVMDENMPPMMPERDNPMRPEGFADQFNQGDKIEPPFGPGSHRGPEDSFLRPADPLTGRPPFVLMNRRDRFNDGPLDIRDRMQPGFGHNALMRPDFCIEKQYNYNHGGRPASEIVDFVPSKVIDYGHIRRPAELDYVTPGQYFEYSHGKNKPLVPAHEIYPRMEFKHWVESEYNIKEYQEGFKAYEDRKRILKSDQWQHRNEPTPIRRHEERARYDDRKPVRERENRKKKGNHDSFKDQKDYREKEKRNRKEREPESWEREIDQLNEETLRKSNMEDRARNKSDRSLKELNVDFDKEEERSKENISRQEKSMKNSANSSSQEFSTKDVQQPLEPPSPPRTLEFPKMSNITMVDDLLYSPGRQNRPPKIAIILRGPPGSGKSYVAKLIKDKEVEQCSSAPRILSLDDYFLAEKEVETIDDNGKKVTNKEMVYEYEEAMEQSYVVSLVKAFKKNITDGFFNFIILDCINEKISDYEEMWSFAKSKGFRVYVCEMEMDVQICLKRNIHKRTEDEINRIVDYFEPTPNYHQILDVSTLLQEQDIEEVQMEEVKSSTKEIKDTNANEDSQDSQEDQQNPMGVSKWERMEAEDKLDRLDGLAKRKNDGKPQTMEDFLQVPDYYNMEDTSGKKRVRWADLEERKEQEKMRAVGFVVGQTNWNRMMDPTKGSSALTRTKFFDLT